MFTSEVNKLLGIYRLYTQAYGPIFSRRLKIFFHSARKTAMLTCKITLPVFISKIPDFGHFISPDGMNSIFSFNKYKKMFFFIFGC